MYAKIFRQIYDSSIADDWILRTVFQDMLVLADSDGIVDMTPQAISARTRIPLDVVNLKLTELTEPDPRSRSKGEEGRRLIPIDPERGWGWKIVNYEVYRNMRCEDDRKAYMRNYMRKYRSRNQDGDVNSVNTCKTPLAKGDPSPSSSASSLRKEDSVKGENPLQAIQKLKAELAAMYKRGNMLIWPQDEEYTAVEIVKRPDWQSELAELQAYRHKAGKYFPGSIISLLNGWDRTLDNARNRKQEGGSIFSKIKAAEALLKNAKDRLSKISVPDRNLYPERYDAAIKQRNPLVDETHRLTKTIEELQRQQLAEV